AMEDFGHQSTLNGTLHGLTDFGETVGFGRVGDGNSLTEVAQTPGDLLNGACPTGEVTDIVIDAGRAVGTVGNFVQGIGSDLAHPDLAAQRGHALSGNTL